VIRFVLNGAEVEVGEHPHLLAALREELNVTSPKDGRSPSGQCGCCTVLVDGKAVVSCNLALAKIEGKAVTTLEGLDPAERDRYADAFAATGALQCGFCTPGIVMRCKYLLDKDGDDLTREKAARHLGAHLCRCTGYHPILDAFELLATGEGARTEPVTGVGSSGIKYLAREYSMGDKDYVDDMRVPGILHAAVVPAEHVRADIVAIDTSAAEAAPGVVRLFTAADVPGDLKIGIIHTDWPVFIPVGGRTSYAGDVLALVVADDRIAARAGAELVRVEYNPAADYRRDRRARAECARRARGVPDSARRAGVPRTGVDPRRTDVRCQRGIEAPRSVVGRAGPCGTTATRSRPSSASINTRLSYTSSPTAARSAVRRTARTSARPRSPRGSCSDR